MSDAVETYDDGATQGAAGSAATTQDVQALIDTVASVGQVETDAIDALGARLDSLLASGSAESEVSTSQADSADSGVTYEVVLTDSQWADVQRCWGWAKHGAGVGLFLALLCVLLLAALLGNRLWVSFGEGWRHG